MTEPMSEARLAEIEARAARARPGPWRSQYRRLVDAGEVVLAEINEAGRDSSYFMAYAREDVPALVVEVRRQRALLDAIRSCVAAPSSLNCEADGTGNEPYPCGRCPTCRVGVAGQQLRRRGLVPVSGRCTLHGRQRSLVLRGPDPTAQRAQDALRRTRLPRRALCGARMIVARLGDLVAVPARVSKCPECGARLSLELLEGEELRGRGWLRPTEACHVACERDDELDDHAYTQDVWQPTLDRVHAWARRCVRVVEDGFEFDHEADA